MKEKETREKQKGITLIALVVTIVVILILAGVSISMLAGENGIIAQAKLAAERTREEEAKEEQDLNKTAEDIPNWVNGGTGGDGSGGGTTLEEAKKKADPFNETIEVKDGDDTMTVPAGFKIKEGENIDTGIVVQDRDGNEFVWVPVKDISNMVMCKNHTTAKITFNKETEKFSCDESGVETHELTKDELVGKLYKFESSDQQPYDQSKVIEYEENSSYREPDTASDASIDTTDQLAIAGFTTDLNDNETVDKDDFKIQLQNEFYEMAKSVGKYGGFYIGRYETSSLDTSTPKVQKDQEPTTNITWYIMYKNSKEIAKGALTEEEKAQKTQSSVTSSMIWGCQWDAVMNWFLSSKVTETKTYVKDSEGMGWYNTTKHNTGEPVDGNKNEVNKIWDMAGNVWEWTMESNNTYGRVYRGGSYGDSGSSYPASYRNDLGYPTGSDDYLGSHSALYVK